MLEGRIANDRPLTNVGEDKKSLAELILGERSTSVELSGSITFQTALDKVDFMPLASANYSGGMIITDWFTDKDNPDESIKLTIRFLSNEVRSDALDIKIFNRKCLDNLLNCKFSLIL